MLKKNGFNITPIWRSPSRGHCSKDSYPTTRPSSFLKLNKYAKKNIFYFWSQDNS